MDITLKFNTLARSVNQLEFISATLKNKIAIERKEGFTPENYFFLTDLVNPARAFWTRKSPDTPKSDELARRLLLGKRLGKLAGVWFRRLPDFFVEEGKLDGLYTGIEGVRGNIDFKIGDSIIEFKTKDNLPNDVNEVFEKYPQDVEQLAFYSAIHPSFPKKNYLVFMNNIPPYKFKAFEIITQDFGKIKDLILRRIKLLREAIENDDPIRLGQCRYYQNNCQYEENNVCKCSELQPLAIDVLKSAIDMNFDEEFTKTLESEKDKSKVPEEMFTTFNVIVPRKYLMSKKFHVEDEWKSDQKREEYIACLGNLVKKLPMQLTAKQIQFINNSIKEPRVYVAHRWLNVRTSIKPKGELLPYLVKVSTINEPENAKRPSQYAITEIGIICASYGKVKGLIFVVYPELNDLVQVYEVIFRDLKEIQGELKIRVDKLEEASKTGDILSVDACQEYMCKSECPLFKICFSNKTS